MRKLHLSRKNRKLLGVLGGAGEVYDIDPTLLRLAVVFLALATAIVPALLTYLIAWLIIPEGEPMTTVEAE